MIHESGSTKNVGLQNRTTALLTHASNNYEYASHHITKANDRTSRTNCIMNRHVSDAAEEGPYCADMRVALQVLIEKTIQMDGQAFVVFDDYNNA